MFYLLCYISRVEPSVLSNELMREFNMTASTFGVVISSLYITYCLMQIPNGILLDKFGSRAIMSVSALLCAIGLFIFGSARGPIQLEIGRLVLGLGSASGFIGCTKVISDLVPPQKYSVYVGISMFVGCLGGICGSVPTAYLVAYFGWRTTTFIIASFGIILSFLATRIVTLNSQADSQAAAKSSPLGGIKILARKPKFWMLGIYGAISYLPLSAIAELWCTPFVEKKYGVPTSTAALSATCIFIGYGIGSIITAGLANFFKSCKKVLFIFTILMICIFIPIIYGNGISLSVCFLLLFFFGIFGGTIPLFFTIAFSMVPKQYGGTSSGFTNMIIMTGGFTFQPLLGKLLDYFRGGIVDANGFPLYTLEMYQSAFQVVLMCMILSIFLIFFIDDVKSSDA
jgi:MFS family permease